MRGYVDPVDWRTIGRQPCVSNSDETDTVSGNPPDFGGMAANRGATDRGIRGRSLRGQDRYRRARCQFRIFVFALFPHVPPDLRHHSPYLRHAPQDGLGTGSADENRSLPFGSRLAGRVLRSESSVAQPAAICRPSAPGVSRAASRVFRPRRNRCLNGVVEAIWAPAQRGQAMPQAWIIGVDENR
jgi:hypothetical protein